jgi:competence protein ComEA
MSIWSKWGFTRGERIAIGILILALLSGILAKQYRNYVSTRYSNSLTQEDSLLIEQLRQYSGGVEEKVATDTSRGTGFTSNNQNILININTATAEELEQLPGIGPALSKRIVEYRSRNGLFVSRDSLIAVPGIGPRKMELLLGKITIDSTIGKD